MPVDMAVAALLAVGAAMGQAAAPPTTQPATAPGLIHVKANSADGNDITEMMGSVISAMMSGVICNSNESDPQRQRAPAATMPAPAVTAAHAKQPGK